MCVTGDCSGDASAASKNAHGPENGQEEAGGGRDVVVTVCRGHSQRETVGWVPLAYSLCELLVCEGSVPKTKRQAVRGLDAQ